MNDLEQLKAFRSIVVRRLEGEVNVTKLYEILHIIQDINNCIKYYV